MVDFNGFDASKILEEIEALVVVFSDSEIIFSNAKARALVTNRSWQQLFFADNLRKQLSHFFTTGELEDQQLFELDYGQEEEQQICHWKFKDLCATGSNRICMAVGKLQKDSALSPPKFSFNTAVGIDPDEIDRYRFLAANIPLTNIFLIDGNLNYILAEGPNFKYWGLDKSHFEGRNLKEVHTTNLEEIRPMVMEALTDRRTVIKELSYMQRRYELTAKPILSGERVAYILGVIRDVSNEYKIRKDLQKSELKYRTLVEESTEIIFSLDHRMEVTYISPNIKQFLGYEPYELVSGGVRKILHPDDLEAFEGHEGNEVDFFETNPHVEFRLKNNKGHYCVFSVNGKVIYDEKGQFRYYTGIARDISKLKEAKKELYLSKEKAEKALFAKSQFLSIMSHEIRTPMNAVIGMSHLLMEENPREDQLENLKTLQFSAENLLELINNILDFSKMDSGKIELEKIPFNIQDILQRIIHSCTYQIRQKNLKMIVDVDPYLPKQVVGDPVRLAQVINNLLSNAIKFTDEGSIRISLEVVDRRKKQVTIRFIFEDTGIGIPADKIDVIFEAFSQASINTTRKYGGTGLGLAIVKKLVDLFGSRIIVKSEPGKGSSFQFDITYARVKKTERKGVEKSTGSAKDLGNLKVLVAEDNLVNQMMLKKILQKWEVRQLVFAGDGEEAIRLYDQTDFDILLLDLQMPVKDGFQVANYIRSLTDAEKSEIPIIALTASSFVEVKEQLEEAGIDDFISKPFIPDDLLSKVIKHIK
jgi:PAS domain S-box-containing protein